MKRWHKVALVVINSALLPFTVPVAWQPTRSYPALLNPVVLAVIHVAATALVVNLYVVVSKWQARRRIKLAETAVAAERGRDRLTFFSPTN